MVLGGIERGSESIVYVLFIERKIGTVIRIIATTIASMETHTTLVQIHWNSL